MTRARKLIMTGCATLTLFASLAAVTPAQAWYRGGWGGGWGYRGGYYGGGWGYPRYGYGGAGLAGAAIGAAVVGAAIANSNQCYHHYPRYDQWGNFIGYTTGAGPCY